MSKPLLSIICAMDSNRVIGKDNALPWHLPADLGFFKRVTMGKPIIMGRKTYESIGRSLPGRQNIVVTRDPTFSRPDCDIAHSFDQAMSLAKTDKEVMLIGGASLFKQTIDSADIMYLTLIHREFSGDTWFPVFDLNAWSQSMREDHHSDEDDSIPYSFVKYVREI